MYIVTLYAFLLVNVAKYQFNDKAFKIQLYFDSYKSSTDWRWNEKCKSYIQLDQLKKIKRTKSRQKRNIKMLQNRSEKIPYVQVKQKNAKS